MPPLGLDPCIRHSLRSSTRELRVLSTHRSSDWGAWDAGVCVLSEVAKNERNGATGGVSRGYNHGMVTTFAGDALCGNFGAAEIQASQTRLHAVRSTLILRPRHIYEGGVPETRVFTS